jgi:multiple sugar transport system permease protein
MKKQRDERSMILTLFALAIALYCLLPFLWFVLTSFKSPAELTAIPPKLVPSFHWGFYHSVLTQHGLLRYIGNSLIVAGGATLTSVTVGSLAAYAVARFQVKWTKFYLLVLLAISMFPQMAIAGPVWAILDQLGWLNTHYGLAAAYIALSAIGHMDSHNVFREVPFEIEEAALIDSCSRASFYKIVLPLAAPRILTRGVIGIHPYLERFFFALIILTDPDVQTLPVGIALLPGEYTMPWGEIAAAVPWRPCLIALTLLFQRGIVRGLSAGAVKG